MLRYCLFALLLLLPACSVLPLQTRLPDDYLPLSLDAEELFAVSPDGETIAYVDAGLKLYRISDGYRQQLSVDRPEALTWAPDGASLVAAFREGEKTHLVRLPEQGEARPQVWIDEQIVDFAWLPDGRLLALAEVHQLTMGWETVRLSLLIWNSRWDVERIPLEQLSFQVTKQLEELGFVHRFAVSPLGDAVLYNRYLDPPMVEGRAEIVFYHLPTGRSQVVARVAQRSAEACFSADGEAVLLQPLAGTLQLVDPWSGEQLQVWPLSGRNCRVAPGRPLYYLAGSLYAGDQRLLRLPVDAVARFSVDGARLFWAGQRRLYLQSGYQLPPKVALSALQKARILKLHQQRSLGELDRATYVRLRQEIFQP